jgi:hydroxymethylbilane synthase
MNRNQAVRLGTRGSPLALQQAQWVKGRLEQHHPGLKVDLITIKTKGDKILDVPLAQVGGKGLFVKEIEEALLTKKVDLAVHSMKDMPGDLPEGLKIGAVPVREDPRDVFLSPHKITLAQVPAKAKIGTGSLRRKAQLLGYRPDLEIIPLRGNLDTRIRKMETQGLAGIVLAAAGLHRLGWHHLISQYLEPEVCLPAVGQGALAIEIRADDFRLEKWISFLHHEESALCTRAERAFLHRLEGGCQVPLAGQARVQGDRLVLTGLIADLEGKIIFKDHREGPIYDPDGLGTALADQLLGLGGREVLDQVYGSNRDEG